MTEGIKVHMRRAHHLGITYDDMKELILQAMYYLGTPKAMFAMRKLKEVMAEHAAEAVHSEKKSKSKKNKAK